MKREQRDETKRRTGSEHEWVADKHVGDGVYVLVEDQGVWVHTLEESVDGCGWVRARARRVQEREMNGMKNETRKPSKGNK